jgi:hypothetical protein
MNPQNKSQPSSIAWSFPVEGIDGSNNVYKNCPAIMSDGRFVTRWDSSNDLTHQIQLLNGIPSSNQFRNFMQQNADVIMASEREFINRNYGCNPQIACSEGYYYLNVRPNPTKYHRTNYTYDASISAANLDRSRMSFAPVVNNDY